MCVQRSNVPPHWSCDRRTADERSFDRFGCSGRVQSYGNVLPKGIYFLSLIVRSLSPRSNRFDPKVSLRYAGLRRQLTEKSQLNQLPNPTWKSLRRLSIPPAGSHQSFGYCLVVASASFAKRSHCRNCRCLLESFPRLL